jgi:N-acetylneuraminic acid mutarotase
MYLVRSKHGEGVSNKVQVFGGKQTGKLFNEYFNDLAELDLATMKWKTYSLTRNAPEKRYGHSGTITPQNQVYIFGGKTGGSFSNTVLNDVTVLDADRLTWTKIPPQGAVPSPRYHHSASLVDHEIFVYGGYDDKVHFNDLHSFNTETNEWRVIKTSGVCHRRSSHSSVYSPAIQKMVIFGGEDGSKKYNDLMILDVPTLTWTTGVSTYGDAPSPRAGHTAVLLHPRILHIFEMILYLLFD